MRKSLIVVLVFALCAAACGDTPTTPGPFHANPPDGHGSPRANPN